MTPVRSAFISGGSSGIGLTVAETLLKAGYGVTIAARRRDKLEAAAHGLRAHGRVEHVVADFRDEAAIAAAVAHHAERFGDLQLLVNNAGIGIAESAHDLSARALDLLLGVNLRSAMLCTREALPLLEASAPSYVINVSSYTGIHPQPGLAGYSASKAGLVAYGDALRAEIGPLGIRVSTICPAFVDTAMAAVVEGHVEPSRLIAPSDVAAVIMTMLTLSPACVIPTVVMEAADGAGGLQGWGEAGRSYRAAA